MKNGGDWLKGIWIEDDWTREAAEHPKQEEGFQISLIELLLELHYNKQSSL